MPGALHSAGCRELQGAQQPDAHGQESSPPTIGCSAGLRHQKGQGLGVGTQQAHCGCFKWGMRHNASLALCWEWPKLGSCASVGAWVYTGLAWVHGPELPGEAHLSQLRPVPLQGLHLLHGGTYTYVSSEPPHLWGAASALPED